MGKTPESKDHPLLLKTSMASSPVRIRLLTSVRAPAEEVWYVPPKVRGMQYIAKDFQERMKAICFLSHPAISKAAKAQVNSLIIYYYNTNMLMNSHWSQVYMHAM
jgi:hypothetical protein